MKKYLICLLMALPSLALAQGIGLSTATESQNLTRAVPVVADFTALASVDLSNASGVFIEVCANSGQTITGGILKVYVWDTSNNEVINIQDAQKNLYSDSQKCEGFYADEVIVRQGFRLMAATVGATVSGGTTVAVYYRVWRGRTP